MKLHALRCYVWLTVLAALFAIGADWTQFRGPGGLATSDEKGLPLLWSSDENVAWKAELPGLGTSSPVTCIASGRINGRR